MDYTNKQIADVFREAKVIIAESDTRFICNAIDAQFEGGKVHIKLTSAASSIICERIFPKVTVESWLQANSPEFSTWYNTRPSDYREQLQLYRLRWLDALIEEFEKKE